MMCELTVISSSQWVNKEVAISQISCFELITWFLELVLFQYGDIYAENKLDFRGLAFRDSQL